MNMQYGTESFWAAVLKREDELRLSPETQALYEEAELRDDTDWMEVTSELQRRVLREFGVGQAGWSGPGMDKALADMRAAPYDWPGLKPLCIYHRHQRSHEGDQMPGDALPAFSMVDVAGSPRTLTQGVPHELCVVFAGSYS
mmetsp:Transcript_26223/g.66744  ORF Transcript_26223/g.66744 Transcript_26223/m.66744 type:complete len:142 (-) Transcript_26223:1096-1521(-)